MRFYLALIFCFACSTVVSAQQPFAVQISELRSDQYSCTVLTENGQLRREVTIIDHGLAGKPQIRESTALPSDIEKLHTLVTEPAFQQASTKNTPGISVVDPKGRIVTIYVKSEGKEQTVSFVDIDGKTSPPQYVGALLFFSQEVKKRELPKIKDSNPICRKLSIR